MREYQKRITSDMFDTLVNDFYVYMNKTAMPSPGARVAWLDQVCLYYESDIIDAFDHMKANLLKIPFNFPKAVRDAANIIISSKPYDNKWVNYGTCEDCNSCGFFSILWFHNKHKKWYQSIKYCSLCDNWKNYTGDPGDRVSKQNLKLQGFKFKPGNVVLSSSSIKASGFGTIGKVKSLARNSVEKIKNKENFKQFKDYSKEEQDDFLTQKKGSV